MVETSAEEIKNKAREFSGKKESWHFHILTPDCQLNKSKQFTLVLESSGQVWSSFSEKRPMEAGEELVKLLHGQDVVQKENIGSGASTSLSVQKIIERAKDLSSQRIYWHHHLLFPDCQFNKHPGEWTLILEDPHHDEILESLSATEPKEDLKQIETLFYSQNDEL